MFNIDFSPSSDKFLKKIDKQLAEKIIKKIEGLAQNPFPSDVKMVVNRKEKIFRVRVGDYRILYIVLYDKNMIYISDIDKRSKAYL